MSLTNRRRLAWAIPAVTSVLLSSFCGATASATQDFVQDRRITLAQARKLSRAAENKSEFPVVINSRVLKWLKYDIGTAEGRRQMRFALARLENYRNMIEKKLKAFKMPKELIAIPLVESEYRNLDARRNPEGAAGLWQLAPTTASALGLRIEPRRDDRLDVDRASDAALRLLLADKKLLNNWGLSVLAYNAGQGAIRNAIQEAGSRDPWVLIRSGVLPAETEEYVPKLMAGILVMQNPKTVQ